MGQAAGAEVVAAGLNGHTVAQCAEADLALEVLQCADVGCRVSRGRHPLQQRPDTVIPLAHPSKAPKACNVGWMPAGMRATPCAVRTSGNGWDCLATGHADQIGRQLQRTWRLRMRSSLAAWEASCCWSSAAAAAMLLTGDHSIALSIGGSPAQLPGRSTPR